MPLVLPLGTTEESLALSALHPPFRYLYTLKIFPLWSFSSPGWLVLSPPAFSQRRGALATSSPLWPFAGPPPVYVHVCLVLGSPRTAPSTPEISLQGWAGEGSPLLTCWPSSASCRPGACCLYLPQHHVIREKASYYYGIITDTHLFLELNGQLLKFKVLNPNFLKRILGKVKSHYKVSTEFAKQSMFLMDTFWAFCNRFKNTFYTLNYQLNWIVSPLDIISWYCMKSFALFWNFISPNKYQNWKRAHHWVNLNTIYFLKQYSTGIAPTRNVPVFIQCSLHIILKNPTTAREQLTAAFLSGEVIF